MHQELNKSAAYTLVELVIVIVILAIVVVFAVPAFSAYGKEQAFSQKIEEVEALMNQTYSLSRNPEKNVLLYELITDNANKKFLLKRCFKLSGSRCSSVSTDYSIVKEVPLLNSETIQNTSASYLACPSNPSLSCGFDTANEFSFIDSDVSTNSVASFTISNPLAINPQRRE
jgi:prepilin-type N-terminal cleavage/methylation domain-containing protein